MVFEHPTLKAVGPPRHLGLESSDLKAEPRPGAACKGRFAPKDGSRSPEAFAAKENIAGDEPRG
jgi:hypothetical protein